MALVLFAGTCVYICAVHFGSLCYFYDFGGLVYATLALFTISSNLGPEICYFEMLYLVMLPRSRCSLFLGLITGFAICS